MMKHLTLIAALLWLTLVGITAMLFIGEAPSAHPAVTDGSPVNQARQQD